MATAVMDQRQQAREAARKAREMAAKIERAAGITSDAERMLAKRRAARDLALPPVANPERRRACLADFYLFAPTYFPRIFCYEFQPTHRRMVDAIVAAAEVGGSQSIAGPRGDGKTTCAAYAGFWLVLRGKVDFVGLVSKNGGQAMEVLDELKNALLFAGDFADDFPEVGWVLQQLVTPKSQTVWGLNTQVVWTSSTICLPTLPTAHLAAHHGWMPGIESCANGGTFSTRGWRGGLRGMKVRGRRPRLVIGDDCDSRESATSGVQTEALRDVFERDIAGLGDSRRGCACVYLGTLINTTCFAAYSTDKERRNWHGIRIPLVTRFPERTDLWAEYVNLRKSAAEHDPMARVAFRFYEERRAEMDAGHETSNPHRYKHDICPDGLPNELSTLQAYYNWVADWGENSALTELQNNPPDEAATEADGLTPHRIQHQVSGFARRVIPPECTCLTMGVDVGKFLLHWVVTAWRPDGTSYLIDYGTQDVRGTSRGTDEGMEQAIVSAIRMLVAEKHEQPYAKPSGEVLPISMTFVDEGWGVTTTAVRAACRDIGRMVETPRGPEPDVQPAKGQGDGAKSDAGRSPGAFRRRLKRDWDTYPGDNWYRSTQRPPPNQQLQIGPINVFIHNAGYWKDWGIQRWLTAIDKPGCRFIWGEFGKNPRQYSMDHAQISYHLCANCYRQEPNRPGVRAWGERPGLDGDKDHWQDAMELADVAASAMAVGLDLGVEPQQAAPEIVDTPRAIVPLAAPSAAAPPKSSSPWGDLQVVHPWQR